MKTSGKRQKNKQKARTQSAIKRVRKIKTLLRKLSDKPTSVEVRTLDKWESHSNPSQVTLNQDI